MKSAWSSQVQAYNPDPWNIPHIHKYDHMKYLWTKNERNCTITGSLFLGLCIFMSSSQKLFTSSPNLSNRLRLVNHDISSAYEIWNDFCSQRQQMMRSLQQDLLERSDLLRLIPCPNSLFEFFFSFLPVIL
ncbi:hypothetical protein SAY86_022748 [Trapa natans]|uniref:Uncharacterized protein n=1 Tax=Trapa natans TaxID=22666 RepID=A0AAN7LNW3_TRANT|nr:hypothetical protein SAY86_022748 [Trapa natans]